MRRVTIAIFLAAATVAVLAPAAAAAPCPGEANATAKAAVQERAMLCLVNRARLSRGLGRLAAPTTLTWAAGRKAGDILRCDDFSHEACGRDSEYWVQRSGYDGCAGENIAYASGRAATPRFIFKLWMGSQGHRENILHPSYEDIGIGLQVGGLESVSNAHVWTQSFGIRGC